MIRDVRIVLFLFAIEAAIPLCMVIPVVLNAKRSYANAVERGEVPSWVVSRILWVALACSVAFRAGKDIVEFFHAGSPSMYSVSVSYENLGHGNVGNEWSFSSSVDSISVGRNSIEMSLSPNEIITLKSVITESDDSMDDIGKKTSYVFVKDGFFTAEQKIKVTENGGRHKGESVTWLVTYRFNAQ